MTSGRDWMFCPTTGSLLKVDDLTGEAKCPLSGWSRSLEGNRGTNALAVYSLSSLCDPDVRRGRPAAISQSAAAL